MSSDKLNISTFIEEQLPSFIKEEFPRFSNFFTSYYKSLEISGGVLDIANNILDYVNFDSLTKENLISETNLTSAVTSSGTTISVNSVKGFPEKEGIILVDREIIFYKEVNKTTNQFLNCARGYSATTALSDLGTTVTNSVAASHTNGSIVKNLSNLILFAFIKNYQNQYLDGFPYTQLDSDIDQVTLLENIKDFYSYKGTTTSIQFLFQSIFAEEVEVFFPRETLLKASTSNWSVDDIIKVEAILGNPGDLVGYQIFQTDIAGTASVSTVLEPILVNSISNAGTIFELNLNILERQNFIVPSTTILRKQLSPSDDTILVDSTIGFPEQQGILQINDEYITYRYKSFNQFFDCVRGAFDSVPANHALNSNINTTEYLYGYKDGIVNDSNLIKMRLIGVLSSATIEDGSSFYESNEDIDLTPNGVVDLRKQFTEWIFNENGRTASSANIAINNAVKNISSDVAAVYKTDDYAYVSSTGLPTHGIGPFRGVSGNPGNQLLLRNIPLQTERLTQAQPVGQKATGIFVNGVESYSCIDLTSEIFGSIESVSIIDGGRGFLTDVNPVFRLSGGGGSGATFSGVTANGQVTSVVVVSGGTGYTSDPTIEIAYGFDATATILNESDIVGGSIRTITITNPGSNYVVPPDVIIRDITGRGRGAFATATISGGTVTGITILNGGVDYNDRNNVVVSLISKGTGVVATANVKRWRYNRVFKLLNDRISSTSPWQSVTSSKVDFSNGYLYEGLDIQRGLEYAYALNPKLLRYELNDNVEGVSLGYQEVTSGFAHSPIIGWAYDGSPIYGPYGYTNPLNSSSGISRMTSSYSLISSIPIGRPNVTNYPLGSFTSDYEFLNGSGSLDQHNGRFCVTPEYPEGVYAYFITVDQFGNGVYPYIIGPTYKYVPSISNFDVSITQLERNLPLQAKRIRTPLMPTTGAEARLFVNAVDRGSIESYEVYDTDPNFKVNDYLYVDSTDTEGSGIIAKVNKIAGVTVSSVTYSVASGFTASGITVISGLTQFSYPTVITCPGVTIPYEAYVTTTEPHRLSINEQIVVNMTARNIPLTMTYKVRVSDYQTITYNDPLVGSTLATDVTFTTTVISVNNITSFRLNDYIRINNEIMRITAITGTLSGNLTVTRAQLGTTLALHNATQTITRHVPVDEFPYQLTVGQTITDGSATGTIYALNKQNRTIEIKVSSGTFTNLSVISDTNSPVRRIAINTVTQKNSYWEVDVTNTGNHYVRNLDFEMIKGTRYVFDVSHPSNSGYSLVFSEDFGNINQINFATISGVPGTTGASIIFDENIFSDLDVPRLYYYELRNRVVNGRNKFNIKNNYVSGTKNITLIDNYTFKYSIDGQPEERTFNNINYETTSESAIGKIISIENIDGGFGYKKLPSVIGITHKEVDAARLSFTLSSGGGFNTVSVLNGGERYSNDVELRIITSTGSGATLSPVLVNGRIQNVTIVKSGKGYRASDRIVAIDKSVIIFPESNSIGKIKTLRFNNYGNRFSLDRTLSKELKFAAKITVTNLTIPYRIGEILNHPNNVSFEVKEINKVGNKSYLLKLNLLSGDLSSVKINTLLTGTVNLSTSIIKNIKYPVVYGNVSGYISRFGYFDDDLGKISASSQKITDSYYYQDYSYVVRTTKSLRSYRKQLNKSTHPLGFKLFGEVSLRDEIAFTASGHTGSVFLPSNPTQNQVIITVSGINVESFISQTRRSVNIINQSILPKIPGTGSALVNVSNNDVDVRRISDLSSQFNGSEKTFNLSTIDGAPTSGMEEYSSLVVLNQIIQEPVETKNISSISYYGGNATITTTEPHGYSYTLSGQTYPTSRYVSITGVTVTGVPYIFNDRFEIYDVPSSNTFTVLFENEVGITTNNDPRTCADVRSTVDNLVGIITNALSIANIGSGVTLPSQNNGIWAVTSGNSDIIAANRHRDGANLITANRTEILNSAYNVISGFTGNPDPVKCIRDIGYIVDAVVLDLYTGGNSNILNATRAYFTPSGTTLISNGVEGEVPQTITAFNAARDLMKLALTNQLSVKDLTIIPDFIPASGVVSNSDLLNAKLRKGSFDFNNGQIMFEEPPGEGSTFYSASYKFVSPADQTRYVYKVKTILFDGITNSFELYKENGTALTTEADENLLVFIDGVLQFYGETYTIDRTVSPNRINFTFTPDKERRFFAYSFGKYKYLDSINNLIDGSQTVFNLQFNSDNYKIGVPDRLLVLLDGVPQLYGDSYTINESVIFFNEPPQANKNCKMLFFYGKSFDKTLSIYDGKVFDPIYTIGDVTPDGCQVWTKNQTSYSYIEPGDRIAIEGETPKELIEIRSQFVKYSDMLQYICLIFDDNSYVRGKNAVASAVVSGTTSGVTSVTLLNGGFDYDTAPVIVFKNSCDNPGKGAKAEPVMRNGSVVGINVLSSGSGYTSAPEVIFAKKYEIIRQKYPVYTRDNIEVSYTPPAYQTGNFLSANSTISSTTSGNVAEKDITVPTISVLMNTISTPVVVMQNPETDNIGNSLGIFEHNAFGYEPLNLDGNNPPFLGSNTNLETFIRLYPNLTIGDFVNRSNQTTGVNEFNEFNLGLETYITVGASLASGITNTDTTIVVSGNTNYFPTVSGYVLFGNEIAQYTTISGQTLLNVSRGLNTTTASGHSAGEYFNIAWRG